jgi:methyl-accepting chemotaxis protein
MAIEAIATDASSLSLELADVAANVDAVSDAAVSETAAFEEIRASTAELLSTTQESASSARAAGAAAAEATQAAQDSATRIAASLDEVQSLASWSAGAAEQLTDVVGVFTELRKAAARLDDMAQQTQILSLNARIEAARSGEHGRGFAVIADSVRSLADDAKATTKEIDGRMKELVTAIDRLAAGGTAAAESAARVDASSQMIREELERVTAAAATASERVEVIVEGAAKAETALKDVDSAIDGVTRDADLQTSNIGDARDRINALRKTAERVMLHSARAGVETQDARMIQVTQDGARRFEQVFEAAVSSGELSLRDLFDDDYQLIPGSDPEQYRTRHCDLTDRVAPDIQEAILQGDSSIRGSCLHDRNGHRPTMNLAFSQPQRHDPAWNAKHARSKGFATDAAGLAASRNTEPVLLQTYRRTAMGSIELTKEASVPIFVRGRHWGCLRTVYGVA